MTINRLTRTQEPTELPFVSLSHHIDARIARDYVEARPVLPWVGEHLKTSCEWCHDLLYRAMDSVLADHESGRDDRVIHRWLRQLGDRYTSRHLCPVDLVEDLAQGRPAALRHVRYCVLCREEVQALERLGRPAMSW